MSVAQGSPSLSPQWKSWTNDPPGFKAFGPCATYMPSQVYDMLFPLRMEKTGYHAFRHLIDLFFLMKVMKLTLSSNQSCNQPHSTTHPTQVAIQIQRTFPKCLLCVGRVTWAGIGKPGQVGPAAPLLSQRGL